MQRVPPPKPTAEGKLQALGYDSVYDPYKGVVIHVRVFDGELKPGMQVRLHHSEKTIEVKEVGSFNPKPYSREKLAQVKPDMSPGIFACRAMLRWATLY